MVLGRLPTSRTHSMHPTRRDLLGLLGTVGLSTLAGCSGTTTDPQISVPTNALTDEEIRVELDGLESEASVVVRASAQSQNQQSNAKTGGQWESRARFEVGDDGTLVVGEQPPVEGTYEDADPMGLFWSKRPADAKSDQQLPPEAIFAPGEESYEVTLTAEVDGESVAEATTARRLFDPEIEERAIDHGDLVGKLFLPPGSEPAPAILHLHGAGGKPHLATARLLASRGFATLALQYFGDPDPIPDTLSEVPVEYAETAVEWLQEQNRVAGQKLGVFGFSRGGALALLLASRNENLGAVVGWVPSGVVWEGLSYGRAPADTSAWSVGGEPVPFLELADADPGPPPAPSLPYYEPALSKASDDEIATAAIPVEDADASMYLVSVTDDQRWPSARLSERVVERLDANSYSHKYRHDSHEGAGHYMRYPYLPTAGTSRNQYNVYGGSQEANARANADAWHETLAFFDDALGE
ncbi:acyl-CoA thioesterase/bile acid-CoA:amino acid N-acyltransferase family protein [Halorussus halophilus]|uniref:acyl-CoA thioesterase/bile acid-CoA:amino acid N-acyltransferase family protein n=1 Tax=Halorussus halophilus TaxID=2650975 RepID=UPI001CE3F2AE|nr:acyl-CoA thioesterase/bile acid-CoA:amino acid N-acyltransferase family protein [Halorussus halophilus]